MLDGKIWVTGASGLAGSAVVRSLQLAGYPRRQIVSTTHSECDVGQPLQVASIIKGMGVQAIIHCAGHVGGVVAHLQHPTEYGMRNAQMAISLMQTALDYRVPKLISLGSVCIYPRNAPSPTREEHLMSGPLEPSNAPYAVAKILSIVLCHAVAKEHGLDWLSLQPANLYGYEDRFSDPVNAHVVPAIMTKMHWAKVSGIKTLNLPGTGSASREFLHAADLGAAVVHVLHRVRASEVPDGLMNVGSGESVSIGALAVRIAGAVGYDGSITFDYTDRDGATVRLTDCERIRRTGWAPSRTISIDELRAIYLSVQWEKQK